MLDLSQYFLPLRTDSIALFTLTLYSNFSSNLFLSRLSLNPINLSYSLALPSNPFALAPKHSDQIFPLTQFLIMEDSWLSSTLASLILLCTKLGSFWSSRSPCTSRYDSVRYCFTCQSLRLWASSGWLRECGCWVSRLRIYWRICQALSSLDIAMSYILLLCLCIIQMRQFIKQSALFLFLSAGIYSCYLISAIYHEKLLKSPYTHIDTEQQGYFSESLLFTLFPPLVATIIGQVILAVQGQATTLPWERCAVISSIININMFTYNQAVVYASFPAVVMAKSCSLLSVIIVGVFFSRVKDSKLKLTHKKLVIGLLATVGIIVFNFFKSHQKSSINQPLTLFSLGNLFLIISLIGDGFLPDFQAQLKSDFKPATIQMYCLINRYTFLISLTLALLTKSAINILDFLLNYHDFASDVLKFSVLNAVGQLFIYRMIKQFRQHIPAFVIAFRKCLTVIVNILWFHHGVNKEQLFGLAFVFAAVLWEVYSNYAEEQEKKKLEFQKMSQSDLEVNENLQIQEETRPQARS